MSGVATWLVLGLLVATALAAWRPVLRWLLVDSDWTRRPVVLYGMALCALVLAVAWPIYVAAWSYARWIHPRFVRWVTTDRERIVELERSIVELETQP